MARRLPPLNALPAFEAAARHLNFSRAADELNLTHGAISRAVKHLEDQLGVQLLHEGDAATGLEQFLLILQKARDWNDGQAKKRLLAAFATLDDAELVGRYRRRMASLLF